MRRRAIKVVAAAVVVGGGLFGGAAYAAGRFPAIPGSDGVIHGCYRLADGRLRVVYPAQPCLRDEAPIYWSQGGPTVRALDIAPLATAVAGQQTQVASLQTQVVGLQGQIADLQTRVVVPPTASPTPTASTVPSGVTGLQSLTIHTALPTGPGIPIQLTAAGLYSDGTTRDVTAIVSWGLVGVTGATLSPSGSFTCPGGGVGGLISVTATLGTIGAIGQENCPYG